ncbi:hypothetical protein CP49_33290 [Bradyrhizobium valentinum]|uniref:Uncharacterized protein n=2 Tax=Bradyrhizobium valentinum TaxID=1518501 RepID=A0A0R3KTS4_9BRAD|nr:hypothetical protein CP49_33290 [Bradyrhizobium valentinum]
MSLFRLRIAELHASAHLLVLSSFEGRLPMSQESKTAGAQYASYLRLLPQSAQAHAQNAADAFAKLFAEGTPSGISAPYIL